MTQAQLKAELTVDEGREHEAYADPVTHGEPYTIGIGHTGPEVHLGLVWDDNQIDDAFGLDVDEATQDCVDAFPWLGLLNDARQCVLFNMCFNMGIHRLAGFVNTLAFMAKENYTAAAQGMLDSVWAKEVPERAQRLATRMKTGVWA